jgi:hypothetical protein
MDHYFLPIIIHLDEWITPAENGIVVLQRYWSFHQSPGSRCY